MISRIVLSPDKLKVLDDFLALEKETKIKYYHVVSSATKRRKIMEIIGGKLCFFCYAIPSYQVSYPYGGISRVERYCNDCFEKRVDREKEGNECRKSFENDPEIINDIDIEQRLISHNY